MLKEEFKNISSSERDLRQFGLVVGGACSLLGLFLLWRGKTGGWYALAAGAAGVIAGFAAPPLLKPLQRPWMMLGIVMGSVMNRVVLAVLYYCILTPIGLIGRLMRYPFLDRPRKGSAASYWSYRSDAEHLASGSSYERQF